MYKDGVPDEDRRRLFQHAKLNVAEQDAINNLVLFGQKVVKVRFSLSLLGALNRAPVASEDPPS